MDDSQIIELYWKRDESAIRETENQYGSYCHSIAFRITNSQEDADECVSDTWLRAWNSIPPNRPDSLMAYLCKIVRNLCLKKYRYNTADKRNSQMDVAMEELEGCLASPEDVEKKIETEELTRAIDQFLGMLFHAEPGH